MGESEGIPPSRAIPPARAEHSLRDVEMSEEPQGEGTRVPIRIARPVGVGVDAQGKPEIIYAPVGHLRPAWPVLPFEPGCIVGAVPRPELVALIRQHLPEFDPEQNSAHWLWAAELVQRSGRSRAEVRAMTYDEIVAFFSVPRGGLSPKAEDNAPPVSEQGAPNKGRKETTAELLTRLWADPAERRLLRAAGSAAGIADYTGRSETSIKESGMIWDEKIKPSLQAARYASRIEREEAKRKRRS